MGGGRWVASVSASRARALGLESCLVSLSSGLLIWKGQDFQVARSSWRSHASTLHAAECYEVTTGQMCLLSGQEALGEGGLTFSVAQTQNTPHVPSQSQGHWPLGWQG